MKNIESNKFALIYEFNSDSPLFVRVADDNFSKGKIEQAIGILEKGIEKYPNYATPYFILAKALALKGSLEKAQELVFNGSSILGNESTRIFYLDEIEKLSKEGMSNFQSRRKLINPNESGIDDELELLAQEIDNAKMPDTVDIENDEINLEVDINNEQIISETLASIYYAQGNYKEALEMYEKLIDVNPDKKKFFQQRIGTIKEQQSKK